MKLTWAGVLGVLVVLSARGTALPSQDAAPTPAVPRLVLHLRWDEAAKRTTMELVAHFPLPSFEALKARVQPLAREHVNPANDFSEVPITIICNPDAPFRNVQQAMAICADPEVRIYKIRLEQEKAPTPDGDRPAPPTSPQSKEPSPPAEFVIGLRLQNGGCRCTTNGWPIGDLPAAREVLAMQLQQAASLGMPVTITADRDVPPTLVAGVVEMCAQAKVPATTVSPALPATPKTK